MSKRTDSVIKGLNLLAKHHDRPYSEWGNKAATAAIAEIDLLSEEIARLRESLTIYVHAHETGNRVPPHIEEHAKSLLPPGPEPKEPNRE